MILRRMAPRREIIFNLFRANKASKESNDPEARSLN